jgi:hypothetical protein
MSVFPVPILAASQPIRTARSFLSILSLSRLLRSAASPFLRAIRVRFGKSRVQFSSLRRPIVDGNANDWSDCVLFYASGDSPALGCCNFGTVIHNSRRTGGYSDHRPILFIRAYSDCNSIKNRVRYNIIYSYSRETMLTRCIFQEDTRGIGGGFDTGTSLSRRCHVLDCFFDIYKEGAAILSQPNMVSGCSTRTDTLWQLNTGLCPGFGTLTLAFLIPTIDLLMR